MIPQQDSSPLIWCWNLWETFLRIQLWFSIQSDTTQLDSTLLSLNGRKSFRFQKRRNSLTFLIWLTKGLFLEILTRMLMLFSYLLRINRKWLLFSLLLRTSVCMDKESVACRYQMKMKIGSNLWTISSVQELESFTHLTQGSVLISSKLSSLILRWDPNGTKTFLLWVKGSSKWDSLFTMRSKNWTQLKIGRTLLNNRECLPILISNKIK